MGNIIYIFVINMYSEKIGLDDTNAAKNNSPIAVLRAKKEEVLEV